MYDQHLNLSGSDSNWRMLNPARSSPDDPAVEAAAATNANDRLPARTGGVGVLTTLLIGAALCVVASPAAAVVPAVAVGVLAAYLFHRHHRIRVDTARRASHTLEATLGPRVWNRASIASPLIGEEIDAAADAARTVSTSLAIRSGALGDPHIVAADLRESLWEAVQMAAVADTRYQKIGVADDHADHYEAHRLTRQSRSVADASFAADLDTLHLYVSTLEALARRVGNVDARTAAAVLDPQLQAVAAQPPAGFDISALQRLAAQVVAAEELEQHGGYKPDHLDPSAG